MELALEAASLHPAQLLGLEKRKGTLDFGADAGQGLVWAPGPLRTWELLRYSGWCQGRWRLPCVQVALPTTTSSLGPFSHQASLPGE